MSAKIRILLLAPFMGAILALAALSAPAAQAAFGVESFFAANCKTSACEAGNVTSEAFTQAGGHPPAGITDFTVNNTGGVPSGVVTHIRTDIAPGVSTNPQVIPMCSMKEFGEEKTAAEVAPGFFLGSSCKPETVIGKNSVVVFDGAGDLPLKGEVYNLVQPTGLSSDFGVALEFPKPFIEEVFKGTPLEKATLFAHTLIEGHVEWASDYHDYFEINVSPALPLVSSELVFKGDIGTGEEPIGSGGFLTNPTSCTGRGPQTTSLVTLKSSGGQEVSKTYEAPLGAENCGAVPFNPAFSLTPETTQSDLPDGIAAEVKVPHDLSPSGIDSSQLNTAGIALPEGMTLNPSAAAGLEACTPKQARINTSESSVFGVACPDKSKIGTVVLNVPGLPEESLKGNVYLGGPLTGPESGPITGPPYTIYVNAESTKYGVDVRLKGSVNPDPTTGRVLATFTENPEQPFSNIKMTFNGGALAPIANPLVCGFAGATTSLSPFTGTPAQTPSGGFNISGCASPVAFSPTQSTQNQAPGNAGAATSFTLNVERGEGQQYLSQIKTVLPPGLVGLIPSVPLCGEPQASKGECPSTSKIGVVGVTAGAGPTPYAFSGSVYLTGPYGGAPYGLSIAVPGVAGPFNLGNVVTRGTINVEPYTARVVATSNLPTIVGGIPLRLRRVTVNINKQGYLLNPTNCGVLATESTLTGFVPGVSGNATKTLSSPFQVVNCNKLAFKPKLGASSGARTSKANGASLETTVNVPAGDANVKSVLVQLPKQLPSRLTTLQKACPEKTFESNPYHCPSGSFVGGARANTPTLPAKLTGPAILVSHGGEAFPDLDLVLQANGVRVILVGNTKIKNGITTTNFANTPDAPVSSITVNLPIGAHSALTANGNLCASKLVMPTTVVAQNGASFKQNMTIKVTNCPVRIAGKKTIGNTAYLTVQTSSPGRISGKGSNVATVFRKLSKAQKSASLKVSLSSAGRRKGRPLRVKIRVGFVPKKKGAPTSVAYTTVTFG